MNVQAGMQVIPACTALKGGCPQLGKGFWRWKASGQVFLHHEPA